MYDYLNRNYLIHPNHQGFLKNCSTATSIQHIFDILLQCLDKGKLCAALFIGFDVINHEILLKMMKLYNFLESTVHWYSSYLLDRYKCVQIESSLDRTSFFYQSFRLWAALPQQVKNSRNKYEFKRRCKTWVEMNKAVKPSQI